MRRRFAGILVAIVLVACACGPRATQLEVRPEAVTLKSHGATHQIHARVLDSEGNEVARAHPILWTSSDASVAAVNENGVVKAIGSGDAVVTAASGNAAGAVAVRVRIIKTLEVTPGVAMIDIGQTRDFDIKALDDRGNLVTGERVKWSTGDPAIATIDDEGVVTAKKGGKTSVKATVLSLHDSSTLVVKEPEEEKKK
ncbi:Ig-like domain-containing protein [bacterium]|nr:Ig-like domain-containing protein [bacterium]